jgi:hypothetical protein
MQRIRTVLLFLALLLVADQISAHEIKVDGNMAVLLHMEPQDSPVIKEPATLLFSYDESGKRFTLPDCECSLEISYKGDVLNNQMLTNQDEAYGYNVASTQFTFPKKGVYAVHIQGTSKTNKFAPFDLSYNVRIEREDISQPPVDPLVTKTDSFYRYYWMGLAVVSFMAVIAIVWNRISINKKL